MANNKKETVPSDEFILEYWQALQKRVVPDTRLIQENIIAVEKLKAKESKQWRDTTNDIPLWKD